MKLEQIKHTVWLIVRVGVFLRMTVVGGWGLTLRKHVRKSSCDSMLVRSYSSNYNVSRRPVI